MSCFLLSILERHNLPPIYSLPAHLFTFHSSLDTAQPAKVSLTHLQELKKQLKQELVVPDVWGQVWGALPTLQLPGAWEGAVLDYAGAQAAQRSTAGEGEAVWDSAGAGGALWHEQSPVLPMSLVTWGWSNSFMQAASRRNSSMSVEVKMSAGKCDCKFAFFVGGSRGLYK